MLEGALNSMLGEQNMKAVQLRKDCKLPDALAKVRVAGQQQPKHRFFSLMLEASLLIEMDREKEAEAIYQTLMAMPEAKKQQMTRAKLEQSIRKMNEESICRQ